MLTKREMRNHCNIVYRCQQNYRTLQIQKAMVISKCIKYLRWRFGNGWRSSWAQSVIGILCSFTGAESTDSDLNTVSWLWWAPLCHAFIWLRTRNHQEPGLHTIQALDDQCGQKSIWDTSTPELTYCSVTTLEGSINCNIYSCRLRRSCFLCKIILLMQWTVKASSKTHSCKMQNCCWKWLHLKARKKLK